MSALLRPCMGGLLGELAAPHVGRISRKMNDRTDIICKCKKLFCSVKISELILEQAVGVLYIYKCVYIYIYIHINARSACMILPYNVI